MMIFFPPLLIKRAKKNMAEKRIENETKIESKWKKMMESNTQWQYISITIHSFIHLNNQTQNTNPKKKKILFCWDWMNKWKLNATNSKKKKKMTEHKEQTLWKEKGKKKKQNQIQLVNSSRMVKCIQFIQKKVNCCHTNKCHQWIQTHNLFLWYKIMVIFFME